MNDSIPVPETDIYAFGLVTFQVFQRSRRYQLFFLLILSRSLQANSHSVELER